MYFSLLESIENHDIKGTFAVIEKASETGEQAGDKASRRCGTHRAGEADGRAGRRCGKNGRAGDGRAAPAELGGDHGGSGV